ncbi:MAG: glycosyltransferase, partial [Desulfobacterales bacterium]
MMIAQLTTVHQRTDIRIRLKQTAWLSKKGAYQVVLFVQDGQGHERDEASGVQIVDTGTRPANRLARMTFGAWRMWRAVHQAGPEVAHFHDPELISVGLVLKLSDVKVIYDVHEDVPRQILAKFYLPLLLRKPVAWVMEAVEWIAGRCFDAVVPATPKIADRFPA